jgi:hypothetical protein
VPVYERAALQPDFADAHYNPANALLDQGEARRSGGSFPARAHIALDLADVTTPGTASPPRAVDAAVAIS